MTLDEKLKAIAEMQAIGIAVRPDTSGGFLVTGVPSLEYLWAATRESAWANAYGWWAAIHIKDRTGGHTAPAKPNTFICAACGKTAELGNEQDALDELAENFGAPADECDVVCDDCYKQMGLGPS